MSQDDMARLVDACEQEPIHIPGGIQAFGAMLVFEPGLQQLCQVSRNAQSVLHQVIDWDTSLASLIGEQPAQALGHSLAAGQSHYLETDGLSVFAYVSAPYWVVEMEALPQDLATLNVRSLLFSAFDTLKAATNPRQLLYDLTDLFRQIAGYDRVMVYQFDPEWHGRVVAESCSDQLHSMLDHHFPASDIPPQARAMYSHNRIRVIASAQQQAVPLLGNPKLDQQAAVDMSKGALRAVSPVHLQYLQNLGVGASCSVGIFQGDRLWGLLACHHAEPKVLPSKLREAIQLVVEFASQRYFLLLAHATQHYQRRTHQVRDALAEHDIALTSPEALVSAHAQRWLQLLDASGCYYQQGEQSVQVGDGLSHAALTALLDWLHTHALRRTFWHTSQLSRDCELNLSGDDANIAGLLAIPMGKQAGQQAWLLFFRLEQVEIKRWAGKPEKQIYHDRAGDMLGPRQSFALWQQKVEGHSLPWQDQTLYAARDIARDLRIVIDSVHLQGLNAKLAELNKRLTHLAERDDLTGIWNRRVAEKRLQDLQTRAERYQRPYTVLLLDLDHFKLINDKHGHKVGDEVLIAVCDAISAEVRDTDTFARWGGEEFMILAPETTFEDARELAERVRQAVADIDIAGLPRVTLSVGIAAHDGAATWDAVVDRADKAMYQAKQGGRNQVAC